MNGNVHRYLGGLIDELRLYGRALTTSEVLARCELNNPIGVTCGDPLTLLFDDFQDNDFSDWTILTPPGTVNNGVIQQQIENDGGSLVLSMEGGDSAGGGNRVAMKGQTYWTDFTLTASMKIVESRNNGSHHGIAFRVQNAGAFYWCMVGGPGNSINVHKFDGGDVLLATTTPGALGLAIAVGQTVQMKVKVGGNRIQCSVDGVLAHDITDNTYSTGAIGLENAGGHDHFDNVTVTSP